MQRWQGKTLAKSKGVNRQFARAFWPSLLSVGFGTDSTMTPKEPARALPTLPHAAGSAAFGPALDHLPPALGGRRSLPRPVPVRPLYPPHWRELCDSARCLTPKGSVFEAETQLVTSRVAAVVRAAVAASLNWSASMGLRFRDPPPRRGRFSGKEPALPQQRDLRGSKFSGKIRTATSQIFPGSPGHRPALKAGLRVFGAFPSNFRRGDSRPARQTRLVGDSRQRRSMRGLRGTGCARKAGSPATSAPRPKARRPALEIDLQCGGTATI